jgi:hypothetical protein
MVDESRDLDRGKSKSEAVDRVQEALAKATEFAKERPHLAVGVAFGVGWLLGNGLHPRVVMGAARLGWRTWVGSALAGGGLLEALGFEQASTPSTQAAVGAPRAMPGGGTPSRGGAAVKE